MDLRTRVAFGGTSLKNKSRNANFVSTKSNVRLLNANRRTNRFNLRLFLKEEMLASSLTQFKMFTRRRDRILTILSATSFVNQTHLRGGKPITIPTAAPIAAPITIAHECRKAQNVSRQLNFSIGTWLYVQNAKILGLRHEYFTGTAKAAKQTSGQCRVQLLNRPDVWILIRMYARFKQNVGGMEQADFCYRLFDCLDLT